MYGNQKVSMLVERTFTFVSYCILFNNYAGYSIIDKYFA